MRRSVYLDHNATTPLSRVALRAMWPHLFRFTANPSSVHADGRAARAALDAARATIAKCLRARPDEIVFTSGGTESNDLAVLGAAADARVVTSALEHPCVLRAAERRAGPGRTPILVRPEADGRIDANRVGDALALGGDVSHLVSIQLANHELGTIQPVREIARIARERRAVVHCDAVQAFGKIDVDVESLGVDLLSISAHKFGGPTGIGALFVRRATRVAPLLAGGSQEFGLRPGTVPVALAAGFAAAASDACAHLEETDVKLRALRRLLLDRLTARVPDAVVLSCAASTLQNTVNVAFPGADREALLIGLDLAGIRVSAGAACASGAVEPSPVLRALPIDDALARSAIRISASRENDERDVNALINALVELVPRARAAR